MAELNGGRHTSDAGFLLLREVAERTGLLRRFAGCFRDLRRADRIEHRVEELLAQRVLAQVQGYEGLNDHDTLRDDPLLALAAGKADLTGATRARERDRGHALAGKSTLNRLELTPADATAASRYQKIVYDGSAVAQVFIDPFVEARPSAPPRIVLDLDATDDPLHGQHVNDRLKVKKSGQLAGESPVVTVQGLNRFLVFQHISSSTSERPEGPAAVGRVRCEAPALGLRAGRRCESAIARASLRREIA